MNSGSTLFLVAAVLVVAAVVVFVATRPGDDVVTDSPEQRDAETETTDPVQLAWKLLTHLMDSDDDEVRMGTLEILGDMQDSRAAAFLRRAQEDDASAEVRLRAAGILALRGEKHFLDLILAIARDEDDSDVYAEAARALGRLGTPEAAAEIVKILSGADERDVDEDSVSQAAFWLARLGYRDAIPALRTLLDESDEDYDEDVALVASGALLALGEADVAKRLLDCVEDDEVEDAAPWLAIPGADTVVPVLVAYVKSDTFDDERGFSALALADVGTDAARAALVAAWETEKALAAEAVKAGETTDRELMGYLASAFARLGDARGLGELATAAADRDTDLVIPALEGASRLGQGVPMEALVKRMAPRQNARTTTDYELARGWAARAILARKP